MCLREDAILGQVDGWLARAFAPHRFGQAIRDLAAAQGPDVTGAEQLEQAAHEIGECDRKLAQYRAALDAGASPATVGAWIAETEAERARHEMTLRRARTRARLTEAQIEAMVAGLADMAATLGNAEPGDKFEIYRELGLKLTYHPGQRLVRGAVDLSAGSHWLFDSVRGGSAPKSQCVLTGEFAVGGRR